MPGAKRDPESSEEYSSEDDSMQDSPDEDEDSVEDEELSSSTIICKKKDTPLPERIDCPLRNKPVNRLLRTSGRNDGITIIIKSLRAEHIPLCVDPNNTVADIRKEYWDLHREWGGGTPCSSLNFICKETYYLLSNDDETLASLGIKSNSVLYLVHGNDIRHTGGFELPEDRPLTSDKANNDIYRINPRHATAANASIAGTTAAPAPSLPFSAATLPSTAATAATLLNEKDDSQIPSFDTVCAKVPRWLNVHGIDNTAGANTYVDMDGNIIHSNELHCSYHLMLMIPPGVQEVLDQAAISTGGADSDFSERIGATKIGQTRDLKVVFKKLQKMRTFHPTFPIMCIIWLHSMGEAKEIELALHTRNSLLRRNSSGEWFSGVKQLGWHQFVQLAEQTPGSTIVYASTNSFPSCSFTDIEFKFTTPGLVYTGRPDWPSNDKLILGHVISRSGLAPHRLPFEFQPGAMKFCPVKICRILRDSVKVGRCTVQPENVAQYFHHMRWAIGSVTTVKYTYVETNDSESLERKAHRELMGRHTAGEWFHSLTDQSEISELSLELRPLFTNQYQSSSRSQRLSGAVEWVTTNTLRRWEGFYNCISYQNIYKCVEAGAIVLLCDNRVLVTSEGYKPRPGELKLLQMADPIDRKPVSFANLEKSIRARHFGDAESKKDIVTKWNAIDADLRAAERFKNVKIRLVTAQFESVAPHQAQNNFRAAFGEEIYNQLGIE